MDMDVSKIELYSEENRVAFLTVGGHVVAFFDNGLFELMPLRAKAAEEVNNLGFKTEWHEGWNTQEFIKVVY